MKQTIFENKQRAEELLQEAIRIWRSSDHPDQLEGIEQDPGERLGPNEERCAGGVLKDADSL